MNLLRMYRYILLLIHWILGEATTDSIIHHQQLASSRLAGKLRLTLKSNCSLDTFSAFAVMSGLRLHAKTMLG